VTSSGHLPPDAGQLTVNFGLDAFCLQQAPESGYPTYYGAMAMVSTTIMLSSITPPTVVPCMRQPQIHEAWQGRVRVYAMDPKHHFPGRENL